MTDSNIQPPSDPNAHVHADGTTGWATETTSNPVPGTEVTQSPGLIPETTSTTEYDPASANVDTAVPPTNHPETVVPSTETGTEWDGTIAPPPYTAGQPDITEVPPTDYAAAVDHQVDSMPSAPPDMPVAPPETHNELMQDPAYAVHVHEQQLNRICDMLEEVCQRVIAIEDKINGMENDIHFQGNDPNNPINDYPEVTQHQTGGSPGLTA